MIKLTIQSKYDNYGTFKRANYILEECFLQLVVNQNYGTTTIPYSNNEKENLRYGSSFQPMNDQTYDTGKV